MTEGEILVAAARGELTRYRNSGAWAYVLNRKRINKKPVLSLIARGFLTLPQGRAARSLSQRIEITEKGLAILRTPHG